MTLTERVGVGLARRIDRRRVLARWATMASGTVAAWAVQGSGALAQTGCPVSAYSSDCYCKYPRNRQCTRVKQGSPSSCDGYRCGDNCRPQPNAYTSTGGCWCSKTCEGNGPNGEDGYYVCCDCQCRGGSCGCSTFVQV
jgi:hypothetical protein